MYIIKHYLGIRDKKDWNKWTFSQQFETFEECMNKYSSWIEAHPGRIISFMQKHVFVPDPEPAK